MTKELWIALADAVFSSAITIITAYVAPEHVDVALALIAILQPLVIVMINSMVKVRVTALTVLSGQPKEVVRALALL